MQCFIKEFSIWIKANGRLISWAPIIHQIEINTTEGISLGNWSSCTCLKFSLNWNWTQLGKFYFKTQQQALIVFDDFVWSGMRWIRLNQPTFADLLITCPWTNAENRYKYFLYIKKLLPCSTVSVCRYGKASHDPLGAVKTRPAPDNKQKQPIAAKWSRGPLRPVKTQQEPIKSAKKWSHDLLKLKQDQSYKRRQPIAAKWSRDPLRAVKSLPEQVRLAKTTDCSKIVPWSFASCKISTRTSQISENNWM